jgi:hypothetical protein
VRIVFSIEIKPNNANDQKKKKNLPLMVAENWMLFVNLILNLMMKILENSTKKNKENPRIIQKINE